jgi:hypothetical protein
LNWSDNSIGESYFQIEEKDENQGFYTAVATADADVTTATIDNLSPATSYVFRIRARGGSGDSGYSNEATVTTPPDPGKICQAPAVCFNGSRFKVDAQWKTPTGASGTATIVRLTDSSGYLWFFDSSNVEVVFKILNGCAINTAYWFYAGGLTNVQVTITVTDTKTGAVKTYANPQGKAFQPVQDVTAFNTCP